MTFEIHPLSETAGAEVLGLDLSKPLSAGEFDTIHAAWLKHLLLVFPDQHLSEEQQIAFSRRLGNLEVHVNASALHPEHPEVYILSNIIEAGKSVGKGVTPYWHSDLSYREVPAKASLLYGREIPEIGGDTLFTNMYLAYEALPRDVKKRLKGKNAVHNISDFEQRYARLSGDTETAKRTIDAAPKIRSLPNVVHPVVIVHPETHRLALYVNEGFTIQILDMPQKESDDLLAFLFAHCIQEQFTYRKKWRRWDLSMWDNRCLNHSATGGFRAPMRRLMHRTTVSGDGPLMAA